MESYSELLDTAPTDICVVSGCKRKWIVLLPTRHIRPSLEIALTKSDTLREVLALCRDHYRLVRRADGIVLGYRYRNGKLRAYVKHDLFEGMPEMWSDPI